MIGQQTIRYVYHKEQKTRGKIEDKTNWICAERGREKKFLNFKRSKVVWTSCRISDGVRTEGVEFRFGNLGRILGAIAAADSGRILQHITQVRRRHRYEDWTDGGSRYRIKRILNR